MNKILQLIAFASALLALTAISASAQQAGPSAAPTTTIETHALASLDTAKPFDAKKATDAYLRQVSGAARERSDAYFEGGYGLLFGDALYAVIVSGILLWFRISARIRDIAEVQTRSRFWQVPIYILMYVPLVALMTLPLTVYEGYFREKAYGLMNQTFLSWLLDQTIELGISIVAALFVVTLVYAAIRRAGRAWWIWGAGIVTVFLVVALVVSPVFIAPLFNHYSPLPPGPLRSDILSLARANGIPAQNVYLVDASRQSDRISANVSGFLGTIRVSLNDNLLHKASHDEALAVLGHEMGHYVMDHATRLLLLNALVILAAFAFLNAGFGALTNIFGGNWDVRTIDDPAGIPLLAALATIFFLAATPVTNTISRTTEIQADMFGVNAVRKPDAFATVVLKLSNYRKLDPGPWEEAIFYDHPSARTRIWEMMRWKAEHLNDADIKAGPVSPQ
ncbi:MAG TPA: M48 family metallopeptidase [Rhizomicrobium sp.]|nr:M48 family metallopeptidase [Rhizomicrobium sp.]